MSRSLPPDQMPGGIQQIGSYRIDGILGASGMAVVYRAFDAVVGRSLAVKVLRVASLASADEIAEARLRFKSEVQTLSRLSPHNNIPILYHFGEEDGFLYFAMELVPGESLDTMISGGKSLRPETAVPIIRQIARALDYAHSHSIVHRDIKPGNILVQPDGCVKIIDFGIARVGSQNLTATGARLGTLPYMAPEQIKGADVKGAADQFSLAVLTYRLFTGRMPFDGTDESVYYQILHAEPPLASQMNALLPARTDAVLRRALKKNPAERFETCGEFAASLEALLDRIPEATEGTHRSEVRAARVSSSGLMWAGLVGLACLIFAAGVVSWKVLDRRDGQAVVQPQAIPKMLGNSPRNQHAQPSTNTSQPIPTSALVVPEKPLPNVSESSAASGPAAKLAGLTEPNLRAGEWEKTEKAQPFPIDLPGQPKPVRTQIIIEPPDLNSPNLNSALPGSNSANPSLRTPPLPKNAPPPVLSESPAPVNVPPPERFIKGGVADAERQQSLLTGYWTDSSTGLMWTYRDNGSDLNWKEAVNYCRSLKLGPYRNWRLPDIGQLAGIYMPGTEKNHIKAGIQLSKPSIWSAVDLAGPHAYRDAYWHGFSLGAYSVDAKSALYFPFAGGEQEPGLVEASGSIRNAIPAALRAELRALCVRR